MDRPGHMGRVSEAGYVVYSVSVLEERVARFVFDLERLDHSSWRQRRTLPQQRALKRRLPTQRTGPGLTEVNTEHRVSLQGLRANRTARGGFWRIVPR